MGIASFAARRHLGRWFLVVFGIGAAVVMVPWTVLLGLSLPARYVTRNWDLTWTGFDTMLLLSFAGIAIAAWRRSRLVGPAAMITATLLACDAWFDITTASTAGDRIGSVITAVAEVPIALALAAFVIVRTLRERHSLPGPG